MLRSEADAETMIQKTRSIRAAASFLLVLTALACGGESGEGGGGGEAMSDNPLLNPESPEVNVQAPASYRARFETSEGDFVVQVQRAWAPVGADRFYNLVSNGYYDGARFFRVIGGFMAQFGMNADPLVTAQWRVATLQDDPVVESNSRGRMTFAMTSQPNTRTTQVFINFGDNVNLDGMGFAPFGEIVEGMDVVDAIAKVETGTGSNGFPNVPVEPVIIISAKRQ